MFECKKTPSLEVTNFLNCIRTIRGCIKSNRYISLRKRHAVLYKQYIKRLVFDLQVTTQSVCYFDFHNTTTFSVAFQKKYIIVQYGNTNFRLINCSSETVVCN